VLKGAKFEIALPDGFKFFNSSGTQVMGTGGIWGMLLTGLITALLNNGLHSRKKASACGLASMD